MDSAEEAGFGALSRAEEFGVKGYRELRGALQDTGLQAHHLIEKRFSDVMGGVDRNGMLSVAVTKAEHQVFTNAWREAIPYGIGTLRATPARVEQVAREIYAQYPSILKALGL